MEAAVLLKGFNMAKSLILFLILCSCATAQTSQPDTANYGDMLRVTWIAPTMDVEGNQENPIKAIKRYGFWIKHESEPWALQRSLFVDVDSMSTDTLEQYYKIVDANIFDKEGRYQLVMTAFDWANNESAASNMSEFYVFDVQEPDTIKPGSPYIIEIRIIKQ